MRRPYRFFFLFALLFIAACDEIRGDENVVDDGRPTIVDFSASPAEVNPGGNVTLSWNVSDASSLTVDQGVGPVTGNSVTVNPTQTTTYTLFASNDQGETTAQTQVVVTGDAPAPGAPTISSFTATPNTVAPGGDVTLAWEVSDAASLSVDQGVGPVTGNSVVVNPAQTTTYTLTATNAQGSVSAGVSVTVGEGGGAPTGTFGVSEDQEDFRNDRPNGVTSPDDERVVTVEAGGTFYAQVDYDDPDGVTGVAINLVNGSPAGVAGTLDPEQQFFTLGDPTGSCDLSGSQTSVTCIYPISVADDAVNIDALDGSGDEFAYVFRTKVTDSAGNTSDEAIRGYVVVEGDGTSDPSPPTDPPGEPDAPTIESFTADPASLSSGGPVTLSWTLSGGEVDELVVLDTNRGSSRDVTGDSSTEVSIDETTTFQLTATGAGGEDTEEVTVTVEEDSPAPDVSVNITPPAATLKPNGTVQLTATVGGSDNTSVTWTVQADGGTVSDTNANEVVYRAPETPGSYTVTATSVADPSVSDSITITVQAATIAAPTISAFTVNPSPIPSGGESTLSWELAGGEAESVTLTDTVRNESADVTNDEDQSKVVSVDETTVFTLTAINEGGTAIEEVTLEVSGEGNGAPDAGLVANDDTFDVDLSEDIPPFEIEEFLSNDQIPEGKFPNIFVSVQPANGTADYDDSLYYTPGENFTGTDSFEYTLTVNDREAGTSFRDTATVTINVTE